MKAYAFVRRGSVGTDAPDAYGLDELPHRIADELWEVREGRLARPVTAWGTDAAGQFVRACLDRTSEHVRAGADPGYLEDLRAHGTRPGMAGVCCAGFIASHAAMSAAGTPAAARAERAWQSRWLAARLGL